MFTTISKHQENNKQIITAIKQIRQINKNNLKNNNKYKKKQYEHRRTIRNN